MSYLDIIRWIEQKSEGSHEGPFTSAPVDASLAEGEPVIVEPADEAVRARPVFWESGGVILGPATVTDFGRAGDQFWLWIEYREEGRWIRDILLRSKAQWKSQQQRGFVGVTTSEG